MCLVLVVVLIRLGFVFCGPNQTDSGNEKHNAQHSINDQFFNVFCTAGSIRKYDSGVYKANYPQDSKQCAKDSFKVHLFFFLTVL